MTTRVATLIASVTAPDMFGAVSTNAHPTPSAFACSTISVMPPRTALRSWGSRGVAPHVRRGNHDRPLSAVRLRLFHDLGDAAAHGIAQLRLGGSAQLVPERDRPLWIAVDQHAAPRRAIGMGCQMRGERALAGAALARGEDDDVHARPCFGPVESRMR